MKITKKQLQRVIQEELKQVLEEGPKRLDEGRVADAVRAAWNTATDPHTRNRIRNWALDRGIPVDFEDLGNWATGRSGPLRPIRRGVRAAHEAANEMGIPGWAQGLGLGTAALAANARLGEYQREASVAEERAANRALGQTEFEQRVSGIEGRPSIFDPGIIRLTPEGYGFPDTPVPLSSYSPDDPIERDRALSAPARYGRLARPVTPMRAADDVGPIEWATQPVSSTEAIAAADPSSHPYASSADISELPYGTQETHFAYQHPSPHTFRDRYSVPGGQTPYVIPRDWSARTEEEHQDLDYALAREKYDPDRPADVMGPLYRALRTGDLGSPTKSDIHAEIEAGLPATDDVGRHHQRFGFGTRTGFHGTAEEKQELDPHVRHRFDESLINDLAEKVLAKLVKK